ncbi:GTP binding protein [Aureococcus anophagefferens]|uniref:GTP binding protein n=1 Tax=Aureococcus anophagefferens TaxID=44056 RepID=A0ABR1GFI3_AURAN
MSVHLKLNLDYLLARMWDAMGLVRVFCKRRGCPRTSTSRSRSRRSARITVEAATARISKELLVVFNYAEDYNRMIAEKRKTRTKEGKKKRSTG